MNNFIYETPTKVYFGKDEELKVGKIVAEFSPRKVLIHYGGQSAKKSGLLDRVKKALDDESISYVELGGGSVMDSAKDIANGVANPEIDVWDFSLGKCIPEKTLNKGCILTLSAAGSEMSNSCVITNEQTGEKRGYGCSCNRMNFAIENPELTYTVSPYQTACGAVDIAMHTIERFFCPGEDTYLTDAIAEAVIKSTMKAGLDCIKNPYDYEARANMMWASSLAHNGLTQCGRNVMLVVHQLEHEVSGMYPKVAHGAGLAAIWCSWARYVYKHNISRWLQYAANVWNLDVDYEHPEKTIEKAIDMQEQYYASIGMPTDLKCLGVREMDLETLTIKCTRNRTRNLPGYKTLEYEDILNIYKMALGCS